MNVGTKLSRKTFLLFLVVCLSISSIGGILPDLEKLWTAGSRGSWHSYYIAFTLWWAGIVLIISWVLLTYLCRPK